MGNSGSSNEALPVHYSSKDGVTIGRHGVSQSIPVSAGKPRHRRRKRNRNSPTEENRRSWCLSHSSLSSNDEEDLNVSYDTGSLKGNLSLKSLHDRNIRFGTRLNSSQSEGTKLNSSQSEVINLNRSTSGEESDKKNSILTFRGSKDCEISAVKSPESKDNGTLSETSKIVVDFGSLLTPPSEDEPAYADISNTSQNLQKIEVDKSLLGLYEADDSSNVTFPNVTTATSENDKHVDVPEFGNISTGFYPLNSADKSDPTEADHFKTVRFTSTSDTPSTASPYRSANSSGPLSGSHSYNSGNLSADDENSEYTNDFSSGKPEVKFQQSLSQRLREYSAGSGTSNSIDSTPELSPFHRAIHLRSSEKNIDVASFSDIATSDSEIFNNLEAEPSESELDDFARIEKEYDIPNLAGELMDINSKIAQLMSKSGTGSELTDEGVIMTQSASSSQELAQKACELVEHKQFQNIKSRSRASSLSDSSFSPHNTTTSIDGVELSWEYEETGPMKAVAVASDEGVQQGFGVNVSGPVGGELDFSDAGSLHSNLSYLPRNVDDTDPTTCDDLETDSCPDGSSPHRLPPVIKGKCTFIYS